jgi:hypothetical protein
VATTRRARTSLGMPRPGPLRLLRGAAAASAAATSSARSRVIPQWQTGARIGTRRPQDGQGQIRGDEAASLTPAS